MAEYIEREELIKRLEVTPLFSPQYEYGELVRKGIIDLVKQRPTADVVEVRHGKWIIKSEIHQMFDDVDEELFVECPFCQRRYYVPFEFEDEKILEYAREEYPYCHCGAKMDGKDG